MFLTLMTLYELRLGESLCWRFCVEEVAISNLCIRSASASRALTSCSNTLMRACVCCRTDAWELSTVGSVGAAVSFSWRLGTDSGGELLGVPDRRSVEPTLGAGLTGR